jgi:hypothetical protein
MKKVALAAALLLALLVACTDDEEITNAAFGAMCTKVSDTSTECASGVCSDAFDQLPTAVCSQKCPPGDGSTCPAGADGQKRCNMKGYCRP